MVQQQESVVLQGEITLLEAINFDLIVYAPYRPLQGFITVSVWSATARMKKTCATGMTRSISYLNYLFISRNWRTFNRRRASSFHRA